MVSYTPKRARANCTFCSMAASIPVSLMAWATAATSSIHAGSKGADPGSTWNLTWECVILFGILLVRKALHLSLSYKKSHFSRPSPVFLFYRSANNLVAHHVGRSLQELIGLVSGIRAKGADFRSLTENIDTTTPGGKLVFHFFGALAEFERGIIQERTRAGLAAARARGRKGGRPKLENSPAKRK